jgi:hypothetical protein
MLYGTLANKQIVTDFLQASGWKVIYKEGWVVVQMDH